MMESLGPEEKNKITTFRPLAGDLMSFSNPVNGPLLREGGIQALLDGERRNV